MHRSSATQRADAVRAFIVGLRLDPACLKEWHPYLDQLEAKGGIDRRSFFRYALWVCAKEESESRRKQLADAGYRDHIFGLHRFLRESGFLSEFGRARRSWFHVGQMTTKVNRRLARRRRFHQGRSLFADLRIGLLHGEDAMSRGRSSRDEVNESLRDYVRKLIKDWHDGLCGGPTIYRLPDRKDGNHLRWPWERNHALDHESRNLARRRRRYTHG